MKGMIIGPRNGGKGSLLGSLSRSMVLKGKDGQEFIGTNEAMGDLNPPLMKWLETGDLDLSGHPNETADCMYSFTIQAPVEGTSLGESLQFWKNKDKTNVSCLGVNYQNPAGSLFSQSTIDHLKAAEFLIICDSAHNITEGHNTGHTNHFENLAHLFLQMYSLDCSLKRVAFIVTNASTLTEAQQSSPIDTALDAVGSKVYEVFKTFCEPDVRFGFFLTEPLKVSSDTLPRTLDQWTPHDTIDPFLFAVNGHAPKHELSLMELEVKCKV